MCYGTVFVAQSDSDWVNVDKQVASTDHRASTAVHIYACSVPFRDVLAALTEEQEDPVAPEWYRLLRARQEEALQKMRGPRFNSTAVKRPSQKRQVERPSARATLVKEVAALGSSLLLVWEVDDCDASPFYPARGAGRERELPSIRGPDRMIRI